MIAKKKWSLALLCVTLTTVTVLPPLPVSADKVPLPGMIAGVIFDADSMPVPQALVVVNDDAGRTIMRQLTTREGAFAFKVPAGTYLVQAGLDQFPSGSAQVTVQPGETVRMRIVLNERLNRGTILGTVLDLNGSPVAEALVVAYGESGRVAARQLTLSDGTFAFKVRAGTYILNAGLHRLPSGKAEVMLRPGGTTEVTITLNETIDEGRITGIVLDLKGAPVAHALVVAYDESGSAVERLLTLRDGTFALTMPAGSYVLQAGLNQFPSGRAEAIVLPGQTTRSTITINE